MSPWSGTDKEVEGQMRVAITGSSGLVGSILVPALTAAGHEVTRVVRREGSAAPGEVAWDPVAGQIDVAGLEGVEAVIHLAGESLLGRWTARRKEAIVTSRVRGTRLLAEALAGMEHPPRVLLAASAVGYYGNRRPLDVVDEASAAGTGFLAETVIAWEAATRPATEAGVRVVEMRFGVVLSAAGGLLKTVYPIFRAGLGGQLGSGRQIMSWIAGSELPLIVQHLLARAELAGPVNVVSPSPVSNAEFTAVLARLLQRPAPFRIPAWLLRRAGGDLAREMLLSGAHVRPRRLDDSAYRFRYPELEGALRHELGLPSVARRAASP